MLMCNLFVVADLVIFYAGFKINFTMQNMVINVFFLHFAEYNAII